MKPWRAVALTLSAATILGTGPAPSALSADGPVPIRARIGFQDEAGTLSGFRSGVTPGSHAEIGTTSSGRRYIDMTAAEGSIRYSARVFRYEAPRGMTMKIRISGRAPDGSGRAVMMRRHAVVRLQRDGALGVSVFDSRHNLLGRKSVRISAAECDTGVGIAEIILGALVSAATGLGCTAGPVTCTATSAAAGAAHSAASELLDDGKDACYEMQQPCGIEYPVGSLTVDRQAYIEDSPGVFAANFVTPGEYNIYLKCVSDCVGGDVDVFVGVSPVYTGTFVAPYITTHFGDVVGVEFALLCGKTYSPFPGPPGPNMTTRGNFASVMIVAARDPNRP